MMKKDRICAPVWAKMQLGPLADYFGGTELDRKIAAQVLEIEHDLPRGILTGEYRRSQGGSNPVKANPSESDQIRPNPSESNLPTGFQPVS